MGHWEQEALEDMGTGAGVVVEHPSKRGINNAGTEKGEGWKVMNKCKNMKKKLKSWHKNVPKKSQKKKRVKRLMDLLKTGDNS